MDEVGVFRVVEQATSLRMLHHRAAAALRTASCAALAAVCAWIARRAGGRVPWAGREAGSGLPAS
eukprot:8219922-Alexandrium_andersonii.AAC.1